MPGRVIRITPGLGLLRSGRQKQLSCVLFLPLPPPAFFVGDSRIKLQVAAAAATASAYVFNAMQPSRAQA